MLLLNKKLYLFGITKSPLCSYCKTYTLLRWNSNTFFCECDSTKYLWLQLNRDFHSELQAYGLLLDWESCLGDKWALSEEWEIFKGFTWILGAFFFFYLFFPKQLLSSCCHCIFIFFFLPLYFQNYNTVVVNITKLYISICVASIT